MNTCATSNWHQTESIAAAEKKVYNYLGKRLKKKDNIRDLISKLNQNKRSQVYGDGGIAMCRSVDLTTGATGGIVAGRKLYRVYSKHQ